MGGWAICFSAQPVRASSAAASVTTANFRFPKVVFILIPFILWILGFFHVLRFFGGFGGGGWLLLFRRRSRFLGRRDRGNSLFRRLFGGRSGGEDLLNLGTQFLGDGTGGPASVDGGKAVFLP